MDVQGGILRSQESAPPATVAGFLLGGVEGGLDVAQLLGPLLAMSMAAMLPAASYPADLW